jgi:pyruvate/2-oxoglutarate dehydrogenase complex dihydrolipoamide dehydrogenase (E3) component
MAEESFDAIVLGTGQSGPAVAEALGSSGLSIAVVEKALFGGSCVNYGCIPTKALVASAKVAHQVRRAAEFGVEIGGGPVTVDMKRVKARKDEISGASQSGVRGWMEHAKNVTVVRGTGRFTGPKTIEVTPVEGDEGGATRTLTAARIFINVGGTASVPAGLLDGPKGLSQVPYMTNKEILELGMVLSFFCCCCCICR